MTYETEILEDIYFSICIPQHGRYPYLHEQIRRLAPQTFRSFEVCISDGGSPDPAHSQTRALLDDLGIPYRYRWSDTTLPYDVNLRSAIGLARGRYCILMGNDDALAGPDVLSRLHADIEAAGGVGVALADFADATTGERAHRIRARFGPATGPRVAVDHFRNFSFVSGIVLERAPAQAVSTDEWDGSEMYQTYVGCRMIASGRPLLELDRVTVVKDLRVAGEPLVESYLRRPRVPAWPIRERLLPLRLLGQVVIAAVQPFVTEPERQVLTRAVVRQLVGITYPFWLLSYRRLQSWPYAAGLALGMRPTHVLDGLAPSPATRLTTAVTFAAATAGGLLVPVTLFERLRRPLYALAKGALSWRRAA